MNEFSVYSICTENYKDALMFTVPSWVRLASVDKVYIYTNFDMDYPNDKVVIINKLPKTEDWLEAVGLRAIMLRDLLSHYELENFAFVDIDCYIQEDISEVFDGDFDVGATRMFKKPTASAGVWFAKNSDRVARFADEWCLEQALYKRKKLGVREWAPSYSQRSFSDILHREYYHKKYLEVLPIDEKIYNYEDNNLNSWLKNKSKFNPKVLHFKGRSWRDPKALQILE